MIQILARFAVRYLIAAALLTLLTVVGVSLFKVTRIWRVVRESQALVESERASRAVALLLRFDAWAAPYPSVSRQLLKGLVQAYSGDERTDDARRVAERMLSDAGAAAPAGFGVALARRTAPLVETIVRAVWAPPPVSRWDGYEWLLHDLQRQQRHAEVETLAADLLARNPDAERRQRILSYRRPPRPAATAPRPVAALPVHPAPALPPESPAPAGEPPSTVATPPAPADPRAGDAWRQALLARRTTLAAELKALQQRAPSDPALRNPHQAEYQIVAAEYRAAEAKAAAVQRKFDSAAGPDRMQYADQLRLMKNQYTDLMARHRRVKAQYDQWEHEHPAHATDSRAAALAAELASLDAELASLGTR
jgi:hypothetical protein